MSATTPSAPLSIRSMQVDLYDFALAADYGYDGQRIFSPSLAWSRDPDIIERMLRDPSISGDLQQYQAEVSGTSFTIQARGKDPYSKKVAEWMEEVCDDLNIFESRVKAARSLLTGQEFFFPESRGRKLCSYAGVIGDFWIPTSLHQMDQRRFRTNVSITPNLETGRAVVDQSLTYFEPHVDPVRKSIHWKWEKVQDVERLLRFIWDNDEARLGQGRGLMEAVYPWWYYATKAMASWSNAGERFGEGFMIALIDDVRIGSVGKDNATIQQAYLDKLDAMRARHRMVMSKNDSIQILEPGQGYKMLVEIVEFCYRNITRCILGAVLPTGGAGSEGSAPKGGSGTQAASTSTRVALHQRLLDEIFTNQFLKLLWDQNCAAFYKVDPGFENAKLPRFVTTVETANDPAKNITVITAALDKEIPLCKDDVYEAIGRKQPTPDDFDRGNVFVGRPPPVPASPFNFGGDTPSGGAAPTEEKENAGLESDPSEGPSNSGAPSGLGAAQK